jgi:hypothetical protein
LSKNVKIQNTKLHYNFVVLYECETLSLALGGENVPRVFENAVLRRIYGLKRDEIIEG